MKWITNELQISRAIVVGVNFCKLDYAKKNKLGGCNFINKRKV